MSSLIDGRVLFVNIFRPCHCSQVDSFMLIHALCHCPYPEPHSQDPFYHQAFAGIHFKCLGDDITGHGWARVPFYCLSVSGSRALTPACTVGLLVLQMSWCPPSTREVGYPTSIGS